MSIARSRRTTFALAAIVAGTMGVGACSSDTPQSSPTTTVSAATPDNLRTIRQAGGTDSVASEMSADSSMRMAWVQYTLAANLAELGTTAPAYVYERAETTIEQVALLATAFAITDEPVELSDEFGGGWQVGPQDGSASSLYVASSSLGEWYFSPAWETPECMDDSVSSKDTNTGEGTPSSPDAPTPVTDETKPAEDSEPMEDPAVGTSIAAPCVLADQQQTNENLPSTEEQIAFAADLLADSGLGKAFEFEADETSDGYVTAYTRIDSMRSPLVSSFQFGESGEVLWASGNLGVVTAVGDYPLVTPAQALERHTEQGGFDRGAGIADSDVATIEPDMGADSSVLVDPMPAEQGEPLEVELTDVTLGLTVIWDVDGVVWLLPAYEYSNADGVQLSVVAVADEYMETVELPDVSYPDGDAIIEPVPGDVPSVEPGVEPAPIEPGVIEPGVGRSDTPPASGAMVVLAPDVVGMTEDEAAKQTAASGWALRVISIDGEGLMGTDDYREDRINVELEEGVVVTATIG